MRLRIGPAVDEAEGAEVRAAGRFCAGERRTALSGANLSGAILTGTKFLGALNLHLTTFDSLRGAILDGVDMAGIDLRGKDLRGASLSGTKLAGALNLRYCGFDNLRGAILDGVDLTGLDLRRTDLSGTKFAGALNLRVATLDNLLALEHWRGPVAGVDLNGLDLSHTDLRGAKFAGARFDAPIPAVFANCASFPSGSDAVVGPGSIVHIAGGRRSGFNIVRVSGNHPDTANHPNAAYYKPRMPTLGTQIAWKAIGVIMTMLSASSRSPTYENRTNARQGFAQPHPSVGVWAITLYYSTLSACEHDRKKLCSSIMHIWKRRGIAHIRHSRHLC
jgi:uncharacterized protein YjbI with pentapeptide repeats